MNSDWFKPTSVPPLTAEELERQYRALRDAPYPPRPAWPIVSPRAHKALRERGIAS